MKRFLAPLFALGFLLSACQPTETSTDTISLGVIAPLTGDAVAIGSDLLSGVKMAVAQVNEAGGVNGKQVEIVAEDGRCNGTDAASAAQKLVNVDGVSVIIGGLCSGETLAAAPIAESAQTVLFSPGSSSPDITDAGDFIFRDYPSDALKTKAFAAYFASEGFERVALISENTDYSQAFRKSLIGDLPEGAVVFDESFEPGTKDYRSLFTRLQSEDFDVFVSNANSDALSALIVEQFREMGLEQPIVGADTMDSALVAGLGSVAEGVLIINVATAGEGTEFETVFTEAYGQPQSSIAWAAYSFDATVLTLEAIAAVGTEGPAIRDYLYGASFDGVIGTFSFDDNGDVEGISYVLKTVDNGSIVTLKDLPLQ